MNNKEKKEIYEAFIDRNIEVLSVSRNKRVEWKTITDVMRHDVSSKPQFKISVENGSGCIVTGDHSLFKPIKNMIEECKGSDFNVGSDLVCVEDEKVINYKVVSNIQIPSMTYMYDLSVEDNQNFVLDSGILAHNSFRPPASEKFIQGQTQVFGFIWEDEELLEYIYMAVDDFNGRPPVTGLELSGLWGSERRWRTSIILRAAAFACFAIAMNWIADEFSFCKDELIRLQDKDGNEYALTAMEVYDILYGDRIRAIQEPTIKEVREIIEEMKSADLKAIFQNKI